MNNFQFKNPTKIIFGKDTIKKITEEIPSDAKVLLLYGGGSIKKNGVYDQVKSALAKADVVEFGGIPANPEYAVLMDFRGQPRRQDGPLWVHRILLCLRDRGEHRPIRP